MDMNETTKYPPIYNLVYDDNIYMLSQRAMAHYLGVTKQSISKKLTMIPYRAAYVIARKLQNTFNGRQKLVPVRYYELDTLKELAYLTHSTQALTVAATLEGLRRNSYQIGRKIIEGKSANAIYLS